MVGIVPFVSQDDIDDMVVDGFTRPNGTIGCVGAAATAATCPYLRRARARTETRLLERGLA